MAGDPATSCLRPEFGGRVRLCDSRTLALRHAKTPLNGVGATSRRHHLNPAEAEGRWRGREEQAVKLAGRDHHTRSVGEKSPAQSARHGIAQRATAGSPLDRQTLLAMPLDVPSPAKNPIGRL